MKLITLKRSPPADALTLLRDRFPGWGITVNADGRWWAARLPLVSEDPGVASLIGVRSPVALYLRLRDAERSPGLFRAIARTEQARYREQAEARTGT